MQLTNFPKFVQNAVKHSHRDGKNYAVDENSKKAISALAKVNGEMNALSGGKIYITKVRSTEASKRRTDRLGLISVEINGKSYQVNPNSHGQCLGLQKFLEQAGVTQADAFRIVSEIKNAVADIHSPHSILFQEQATGANSASVFKPWLEIHDPNQSSLIGRGSRAEARFVQDLENSEMKLVKVIGSQNRNTVNTEVAAEEKFLKMLGRWHGELGRTSGTTKLSGSGQVRTEKGYVITDYVGDEIYSNILAKHGAKELVLYKGEKNLSKQLAAFTELAKSAVEEMKFVHDKGILHKDIKPDNMTLTADGKVHFIDFGFARVGTGPNLIYEGSLKGTPGFSDPALGSLAKYGKHTEVYAMGLSLAEMMPAGACAMPPPTKEQAVDYPITAVSMFRDALPTDAAKHDYDAMIELLNSCGDRDVTKRPSSEKLIKEFQELGQKFESHFQQEKSAKANVAPIGPNVVAKPMHTRNRTLAAANVAGPSTGTPNAIPLSKQSETALDALNTAANEFLRNAASYESKNDTSDTHRDRVGTLNEMKKVVSRLENILKNPVVPDIEKLEAVRNAQISISSLISNASGHTFSSKNQTFKPIVQDLSDALSDIDRNLHKSINFPLKASSALRAGQPSQQPVPQAGPPGFYPAHGGALSKPIATQQPLRPGSRH